MLLKPFDEGWSVAPKQALFAAVLAPAEPQAVALPHDALRDLPRDANSVNGSHTGYFPSAHVVYEKTIDVPEHWAEKVVAVRFDGVYRDAVVYLDGDLVAQRPSGYSPFTVDLSAWLRVGASHVLRVEARTHRDSRWYTGVGIYRDVRLAVGDPVHVPIDGVVITTPRIENGLAVVHVDAEVRNDSRRRRSVRLVSRLRDASGAVIGESSAPVTILPGEPASVRVRHHLRDAALWSPDSPVLHTAETIVVDDGLELDRDETRFGIRSLTVDPLLGLRVNGEVVKLRGGCVHHDNGPLGAAAHPAAEHRRVAVMKAAGFNAVRSSHNPASRALLDACDELGMFIVDELADVWTVGKSSYDTSLSFPEWWERDAEAWVCNARNHPSVILYSIGNEILEIGRPGAAVWGRRLVAKVRELDPTRPVTNAVNALVSMLDSRATARDDSEPLDFNTILGSDGSASVGASEAATRATEEAHAQVDVAGINYAEARYDLDSEIFPNRVLLGTESFPARLDRIWALVQKHPQVIGDFAWTGWDHLGEAGTGRAVYADDPLRPVGMASPYPWLLSHSGTIDINGIRRPISFWRETVWGLRDEPYIAVHRPQGHGRDLTVGRWSWDDVLSSWAWGVPDGSPLVVDVYTDADEVELFLDDESLGIRPVGVEFEGRERGFIARFRTAYRRGVLRAVALRGGEVAGTAELRSPVGEILLHVDVEREHVEAKGDLAFVHFTLRDARGTLAVDDVATVTVTVEGPGELVALSSAKPDDEAGFADRVHATYEGRLLAIIRPTGAGRIRVRATSDRGAAEVEVNAG